MTDAKNVDTGGMGRRISEVRDLIDTMTIIDPGAAVDFVGKLAGENGWTHDHASQVYGEYRRFLLMAWMSPTMVVPSHDVDQAWHLHLTHTRHYWDVLCGTILMKPLHHDPSLGTRADAGRHADHYGSTLSLYRYLFDEEPPHAIWPCGRLARHPSTGQAVLASGASATATAVFVAAGIMAIMSGHPVAGAIGLLVAILLLVFTMAQSAVAQEGRRRTHAYKGAPSRSGYRGSSRATSERTDTSGSDGALAFMAWTDPGSGGTVHGSGNAHGHGHGHGHGTTDSGHSDGGHSCGTSCGGGGCGGGD